MTEPVEPGAGHRKLTAMPAVTCSAWLGFGVPLSRVKGNRKVASARLAQASESDNSGEANAATRDWFGEMGFIALVSRSLTTPSSATGAAGTTAARRGKGGDRKSTRLNSSHG